MPSATTKTTVGEDIDDASITAQVKISLLYHRSTSALNTKVETVPSNIIAGLFMKSIGANPRDLKTVLFKGSSEAVTAILGGHQIATFGWVLDSGTNSGGGWFLEQWFARAGEPYADNDNGRSAPATEVLPCGTSSRRS